MWTIRNTTWDGTHVIGKHKTLRAALKRAVEGWPPATWHGGLSWSGDDGDQISITGTTAATADDDAANAEFIAEQRALLTPTDEPQDTCGCGRRGYFPEGRCYQCQCEAHACGEIDMDHDEWRGPVELARIEDDSDPADECTPEEAAAWAAGAAARHAEYERQLALNCDEIPF